MTDETEPIVPGEAPPEESGKGKQPCVRCKERPRGFGQLGRYCRECRDELREESDRKQSARNEATAPKRPRGNPTSLEREIKDALLGTAAVAAVGDPGIYVAINATVDEVAAAYANLARSYPATEPYIRGMLGSGVVMAAAGSTMAMVVAIMACTGHVPRRLVPMAYFVMGSHDDVGAYVTMKQARQPAPPPPPPDDIVDMAA